jgi:hypothetical protein
MVCLFACPAATSLPTSNENGSLPAFDKINNYFIIVVSLTFEK